MRGQGRWHGGRRRRHGGRRRGCGRPPVTIHISNFSLTQNGALEHFSLRRTFFPLNCSITLSAPAASTNTISAITVGLAATSRQLTSSPPTLFITLSISAAVVPGAKFCATITSGAVAAPRILSPALPFTTPLLLRDPTSGRVEEGREGRSIRSLRRRVRGATFERGLRGVLARGREELRLEMPTREARLFWRGEALGPVGGALERRPLLERSFWASASACRFLRSGWLSVLGM